MLSKDGTFGGNDTIVAASRRLNCSIIIHQPNAPRWEVHPPNPPSSSLTLHIAYLHGEHYCSVHRIAGMGGERGGVSDHVTARKKTAKSGDVSQSAAPKKLVSTPEAGATAMMRDCSITEEPVSLKFQIFVYTSCIKCHFKLPK